MTQPYGQQPPGQQPGGFPQAPGYQPGMGGMPAAPQEYSQGPIPRPGPVTAAAVLAYIQAGITTITSLLLLIGLANASSAVGGAELGLLWVVALAQVAGVVLLIMGGVQIMGGKGRTMLVAGAVLELVICLYYLINFAVLETGGIDVFEQAKGTLIAVAIFFAIMPTISLIMSAGGSATQYLQSRRAR